MELDKKDVSKDQIIEGQASQEQGAMAQSEDGDKAVNKDVSVSNTQDNKIPEKLASASAKSEKPSYDGRFKLEDDGRIFWQKDTTNPLPGDHIGVLAKGEDIYHPSIKLSGEQTTQENAAKWLDETIKETFGSIIGLNQSEALSESMKAIVSDLYKHLGVTKRQDVFEAVQKLTEDDRKIIRMHRLRMGPILLYFSEMLKPAAIHLKSVLWGLYHGHDLPLAMPNDGLVSEIVEDKNVEYNFYRIIGYPVYGQRAIRIDMLDRVVIDIYESAVEGEFKVQYKYAEWLGCNIEGLYGVLKGLGHYMVHDPATEAAANNAPASDVSVDEKTSEEPKIAEDAKADTENVEVAKTDSEGDATPEAKKDDFVKPELATFRLKKGRLADRKRPVKKHDDNAKGGQSFHGKKDNMSKKDKKKIKKVKGDRRKSEPKVMSFGDMQKDDDNPFAVLKQLNLKDK